jgi:hypothetical protein
VLWYKQSTLAAKNPTEAGITTRPFNLTMNVQCAPGITARTSALNKRCLDFMQAMFQGTNTKSTNYKPLWKKDNEEGTGGLLPSAEASSGVLASCHP